MDGAIASALTNAAMIVRSPWSDDHARAAEAQHRAKPAPGRADTYSAIEEEHRPR